MILDVWMFVMLIVFGVGGVGGVFLNMMGLGIVGIWLFGLGI